MSDLRFPLSLAVCVQTDEFLRNDVDSIIEALGPRKKMDLYQIARNFRSVEESVAFLGQLVSEGKFRHIGMSEVSAATLRKAHAVSWSRRPFLCLLRLTGR